MAHVTHLVFLRPADIGIGAFGDNRRPATIMASTVQMMQKTFPAAIAAFSVAAQAQAIDRVAGGDDQLRTAQLHAEATSMDKAAVEAKMAEDEGNRTATIGRAAGLAAKIGGSTGLFDQIGGVLGNVVGQTATETAAGAAQQAAERGHRTLARKEQLAGLFAAKGCKANDLCYEPPARPAAAVTAAPAAPAAPAQAPSALPDNDPDPFFKGKMGGTFGADVIEVLPNSKRVAILGFRVAFVTSNTATALVGASYPPGRDAGGALRTATGTFARLFQKCSAR